MLDPFQLEFVQRGVLEVLLLSGAAGLLGTWIVMRGLTFYAHAVGTAAFPGLVLADGLGFSAPLGALAAALVFAFGVERLARRPRAGYDSLTALVLVAALAGGVVLASDVFHSGGNVDSLLFGSLLLTGTRDLVLAGAASAAAIAATLTLGPRWLARGFDPAAARAMGLRSQWPDALLLVLIAFAIVASLTAIGALLATALFVVPAATVRLWTQRLPVWQPGVGRARGRAGHRRPVALGAAEHAARADRRRARRRALRGVAGLAADRRRGARPRGARRDGSAARARPLRLRRRLVGEFGPRCRRDDDADRRLGARGRRRRGRRAPDPAAQHRSRTSTSRGPPTCRRWPTRRSCSRAATGSTPGWTTVISNAGGSPRVVDLGAKVPVRLAGESEGDEASRFDPHWWHDPRNAQAAVARHPRRARRRRSARTRRPTAPTRPRTSTRLRALDAGIRACFASVPAAQRKLVSDHDAFNYFAHRYGIAVVGAVIPSQTTQAQASAGDIADLVKLVRRERVRAIFPESSLSPKLAEQIARETGARADYTLYGDTLGPSDSSGATYLSMEQANADAMTRGFTGGARGCEIAGIG